MHEIGVLIEIVKQVEQIAITNDVDRIESLVLQIGELSSMVPDYMQKLYPAAIEGTVLEHSTLKIEVIPANGLCKDCRKVFHLIKAKGTCPNCQSKSFELLSGREFMIKEISCC